MPIGNPDSVSDEDLGMLIKWINDGAPESCDEPDPDPEPGACVPFETALSIMQDNTCLNCHTGSYSGGLDLSTYDGVMAGGNSGAAVNDGDGAGSLLVTRLKTETSTGQVMPPPAPDSVSDADIQGLINWINGGANDTCD